MTANASEKSNAREKAARAWARSASVTGDEQAVSGDDAMTAVVAHGLLGNLAVIRGTARMLLGDKELDAAERHKLLLMLESQVDLMQGVLADLVRGLPSKALAVLDELGPR